MGVLSTYCQICGLPVQLDHYVPARDGGYFRIWRGDGDDGCEPAVVFGTEHGWLRDAVGLPLHGDDAVIEGVVHDGMFEGSGSDDFVGDGCDDRAALHRACWDLAGRPGTFEPLLDLVLPEAEERYRGQLFEFADFVADGHGWMLIDPTTGSPDALRNRRRITDLLP